jgi:peptidoglycan/LPS O-acetylase OafA/YrhL
MKIDIHSLRQSAYRPEIDGLRALAVVAVITNHFNKGILPSGYLGVDIFFVISGYVVTASLYERRNASLANFLLDFYARRIKRILPALVACTVLTSLVICLFDPTPRISLKTGSASLLGLSNLYLLQQATDYFSPAAEANAFTQTWSLGVEEQFYLISPWLLWLGDIGKLHSDSGHPRRLLWLLSLLSAMSLFGFVYLYGTNQPAAYFMMPTRLWELGAGAIAFLATGLSRGHFATPQTRLNSTALLLLVLGSLFIPADYPVLATMLSVLLTVLLVVAIHSNGLAFKILTTPGAQFVGKISYSLYLWHWSVLILCRLTLGIAWWSVPILVALMFSLSYASYKFLELPLRHAIWDNRNWKVVGYGLALSVISVGVVSTLSSNHKQLLQIDFPPAFVRLKSTNFKFESTCVVDGKEKSIRSGIFDQCTVAPTQRNGRTIWVLGDSHAGHLQGMFYSVHDQTAMGVHLIETPGVPFPVSRNAISEVREEIFEEIIRRAKKGDIVAVSRLFFDRSTGLEMADLADWYTDLTNLAHYLTPRDIRLVVIGPPPMFKFEFIGSCVLSSTNNHSACDAAREKMSPRIENVERALENATKSASNAFVFKPFSLLCPATSEQCSPMKNGDLLYRDKDHLNSLGSASISDGFIVFLREHGLLQE